MDVNPGLVIGGQSLFRGKLWKIPFKLVEQARAYECEILCRVKTFGVVVSLTKLSEISFFHDIFPHSAIFLYKSVQQYTSLICSP